MADFRTGTAGRHYLELPAEPSSVSCAREHVAVVLASLGLTSRELIDDAQLITSELVTNAITASIASGPACGAPNGLGNGRGSGLGNGGRNGLGGGTANGAASPPGDKRVRVSAHLSGNCLTLEFWDGGAGVPKQMTPGEHEVSGRGLLLVEALSRRWGYHPAAPGGKTVWVELDISSYLCESPASR